MTGRHAPAQHRHAAASRAPPPDDRTPADRYEELFVDVQRARVFEDSKTFVDCSPRIEPEAILAAYRSRRALAGFELAAFVHEHFDAPRPAHSDYVPVKGQSLVEHIDTLWPYLTREPELHPLRGSLLQLPHPYVVPGGRFVELYYWDSYFTMLGLAESGRAQLVHAMTENFAYLIDRYGHVPNGTRTYYVSRSQPPVFALMVRLCEDVVGHAATEYLPQLRREHAFWMDGERELAPGQAHRRLVRLADGTLLNRYWDDRCTPREESWREDVATAAQGSRPAQDVYRHLRAAAESGWDFSSRWLDETANPSLSSIRTTDLLPVDLNAFMYELERTIARLSKATGDNAASEEFDTRASRRAEQINANFWDDGAGIYVDFDWREQRRRSRFTAAALVPLFCGVAAQTQADAMARAVSTRLLAPGGIGTSETISGEQWDRPNGWAPLQWMAVQGFARYGLNTIAGDIRKRWLASVQSLYGREGKLVEKYQLRPDTAHPVKGGGGGEYPLQDGFGWTNGVTRRWLHETATAASAG
jgi:alpha,alpha-trehalase